MALKTKSSESAKVFDRKARIIELREKHKDLLVLEGVGDKGKFIPKMAYIPGPGKDKCISFFESEIRGGQDVYTEFVSSSYDCEDPDRKLYKWVYNPHWEEEYEKTEPNAKTGHCRYLIPVDELIDVESAHGGTMQSKIQDTQQEMSFEDLPDADDDAAINKLTIRDKAAIDWKLPVSRKKWLNDLIRETFEIDE